MKATFSFMDWHLDCRKASGSNWSVLKALSFSWSSAFASWPLALPLDGADGADALDRDDLADAITTYWSQSLSLSLSILKSSCTKRFSIWENLETEGRKGDFRFRYLLLLLLAISPKGGMIRRWDPGRRISINLSFCVYWKNNLLQLEEADFGRRKRRRRMRNPARHYSSCMESWAWSFLRSLPARETIGAWKGFMYEDGYRVLRHFVLDHTFTHGPCFWDLLFEWNEINQVFNQPSVNSILLYLYFII